MGRLFGTDGVRGIANTDLSCERALAIGRAAAMVLADGCRRRPVVAVGADTRTSSDMLACAAMAGLCSVGADVIDLGVVPTPAVAYLVGKYKADAGIMISASHNPAEYNGLKVFSGDGYKLPDALEEQIEAMVLDPAEEWPTPIGGSVGKITRAQYAARDYAEHVKSSVLYSLDGLHIAIDCANGASSVTAKQIFEGLGAQVEILFDRPNGTNINDGCGSTHMEALAAYVRENQLDAGIAFDGDADRCLAVDEQGNLIDGDQIMAICALDLHERGRLAKKTVVGTIMTNFGFSRFCDKHGLRFLATKVGDRFVLEEMQLEDTNFGGEQSGHIIFRDFATTGDGQLTAAQLLSLMRRKQIPLSTLASVMTRYPQITLNLTVTPDGKLHFYTNPVVREAIDAAKTALGDRGRIVVRPSGTEPYLRVMVEGEDEEEINRIAQETAEVILAQLGK
ncbi:MAG: phosphoglucosamine mutase [Clostridia bacterium]|nr:phosphoglucosamine mutase [Clostridia bacterium]